MSESTSTEKADGCSIFSTAFSTSCSTPSSASSCEEVTIGTYRNDHQAALDRIDALERELAALKTRPPPKSEPEPVVTKPPPVMPDEPDVEPISEARMAVYMFLGLIAGFILWGMTSYHH